MIRWPLLPLNPFYWIGITLKNFFYDTKISKSDSFDIPIICIGNLKVGGTGKSPHTMYVLNLFKNNHKMAVLSRGYGRRTFGYHVANYQSDYRTVGDEPMQFFTRFKNKVVVAVCEDRVSGVKRLMKDFDIDAIVLDDAFQHRKIKAGFYILLTEYNDLYVDDMLLPAGNLREPSQSAKRADIIVVTKCPESISEKEKDDIRYKLKLSKNRKLFFSFIEYDTQLISDRYKLDIQELEEYNVLLITGIANEKPLIHFLKDKAQKIEHLKYKDHHQYTQEDVKKIEDKFYELASPKIILTTEKDYTRLELYHNLLEDLYYLPINVKFDNNTSFNTQLLEYMQK